MGQNIWILEGDPVSMLGIPFQTRTTVIKLSAGGCWLHSPVALTEARANSVQQLGDVAHLVAPNSLHHLFMPAWATRFPQSTVWLTPDLPKKLPGLRRYELLDAASQSAWADDIEQCYFEGSFWLTEAVFYHRASKTLIVTDIIQNHDPAHETPFWRLVKRCNAALAPQGGVPRDLRLTIRDRKLASASVQKILRWDFQQIILCHGLCITTHARDHFRRAFDWLI